MWINKTRNATIKGGGLNKTLNGMKIFILIFFYIKETKITRGHSFTLVKEQI